MRAEAGYFSKFLYMVNILPRNTAFEKSSSLPAFLGKAAELCLQTVLPEVAGIHSVPRPWRKMDKIHPVALFPNLCCWNILTIKKVVRRFNLNYIEAPFKTSYSRLLSDSR